MSAIELFQHRRVSSTPLSQHRAQGGNTGRFFRLLFNNVWLVMCHVCVVRVSLTMTPPCAELALWQCKVVVAELLKQQLVELVIDHCRKVRVGSQVVR